MKGFGLVLAFGLTTALLQPFALFCQDDATKAAPEPVYKAGGGVKPPRAIFSPDPEYTTKARSEHQRGTVAMKVVVGADGLTRDIKVDRSLSPDLDKAAMDAVKRWRFTPGTKDGKPVAVQISVTVSFNPY